MSSATLGHYSVLDQPGPDRTSPPGEITLRSEPLVMQRVIQRIKVSVRKPEPMPAEILLGTLNHPGFRVLKPIPVHIDVDGGAVIATWRETDEFGTGTSASSACADLGRGIAELYESLRADEALLGPDLMNVWNVLKENIAPRT
jgi:hypothetical protein